MTTLPPQPTLRAMRRQLGLTQAKLADVLESTQQTISEQETGKTKIRRERIWAMQWLVEHPEELEEDDDADA